MQLKRETRSRLRPPSGLRLAPRAPAIEEIHEERLAAPAPLAAATPNMPSAAVTGQSSTASIARQSVSVPSAPSFSLPASKLEHRPTSAPGEQHWDAVHTVNRTAARLSAQPAAEAPPASHPSARETHMPVARRMPAPTADRTPAMRTTQAAANAEPRTKVQKQRWETDREIPETTIRSESYVLDEGPAAAESPRSVEFAIPQPVRAWLRQDSERPAAPPAARGPVAAHTPPPQPAAQPVIDVTIGKIEVTVEGEPHRPVLAVRRAAAPVAAPTRHAPPMAGRLARQYLDR